MKNSQIRQMNSTIGEERFYNQRVLIDDINQFIDHMVSLNLPNPKMMDIVMNVNQVCGEISVPKEH